MSKVKIPPANEKESHLKTTGKGYAFAETRTELTLSDDAKVRRKKFVSHYIKTTNGTAAATFAGFKSPRSKASQLLHEPYVQLLIHESLEEMKLDAIMTQQEILFRFKQEATNLEAGNQSARVAALAHISKIQGMLIDKAELSVGGGVMLVPMLGDADDWSEFAEHAQNKLKKEIKD